MPAPTRHRVVMIGPLPRRVTEELVEAYDARELESLEATAGVEVAAVGGFTKVDASVMDRLPDLRAIANYGVGYDNIDVDEARDRGIAVSNTPDVLDDAVADLTVALVLDVVRGVSAADRFVRRGDWAAGERVRLTRDVRGLRVGILGLGRIGRAVAARLEVFGTTVGYHSRSPKDVAWAYHDSPVALAEASDVLVVLTPGGPRPRAWSTPRCCTRSAPRATSSTWRAGRWSTRTRWSPPSRRAASPAPGSTCSPTSPGCRRRSSTATTSCSSRTWAAPLSRRVTRWGGWSSTTSRRTSTAASW